MAGLGPPLEQLRDGVPDPGRDRRPARPLGPHDRVVRLRRLAPAGLAHDHLPAVLRRRRHLLRVRDGADPGPSPQGGLQARGPDHAVPHRLHVQDHPGDGHHGALPLRAVYRLEDLITQYHIDCMCKITLATGTMVGYAYAVEFFIAWYSANPFEGFGFINQAFGPYWWAYWVMVGCCVVTPQLFWFRKVRQNTVFVFILSLIINLGMWFERF